jgi:hypothetical protein
MFWHDFGSVLRLTELGAVCDQFDRVTAMACVAASGLSQPDFENHLKTRVKLFASSGMKVSMTSASIELIQIQFCSEVSSLQSFSLDRCDWTEHLFGFQTF